MKRILFLLSILVAFSSCSSYRDVIINSVELKAFSLQSTSKAMISFDVEVDNPTNKTLYLSDLSGTLSEGDQEFAEFRLTDKASVPPKSTSQADVEVDIKLTNPMILMSIGLNIDSWDMSNFIINGEAIVETSSGLKRKMKLKDITLEELLNSIDN